MVDAVRRRRSPARLVTRTIVVAAIVITGLLIGLPMLHRHMLRQPLPPPDRSTEAWKTRQDALTRAQVLVERPPDIPPLDLGRNPSDPHPFAPDDLITCRYVSETTSGTSPKFSCGLPSGDVLKVKYGVSPEIPAEVAATRLLAALGFGADHVSRIQRVHCMGCPPSPYRLRRSFEHLFLAPLFDWFLNYSHGRTFTAVSVERKLDGRTFEIDPYTGWSFDELSSVSAQHGGAMRAEIDALRLVAVLLGHWDNKPDNQRLVCLEGSARDPASARPCARPLLVLHDVGSTFGARSAGYEGWKTAPIWTDRPTCTIGMTTLPYGGATFKPVSISEEGRQLLAGKLRQLSSRQLQDLFAGSGYGAGRDSGEPGVALWVETFLAKVRDISDGAACALVRQ